MIKYEHKDLKIEFDNVDQLIKFVSAISGKPSEPKKQKPTKQKKQKPKRKKRFMWTENADQFIIQNHKVMSKAEIVKNLGIVSVKSLERRLERLSTRGRI